MVFELTWEQAADRGYVSCLIDGAAGIYVPQQFAERFDRERWHVSKDDHAILLAGPDHEFYWETWGDVCDSAWYGYYDGERHGPDNYRAVRLWQDGDLFAVRTQHGQNDVDIVD